MGNSDSDSENECFESAEESLDEDEEVKSVGTKSKKSENKVVEPVCDNVESSRQLEKDVSGNSMSYRKRPDRVKRSNSSTTTKPVPKLPSTEAIFKAEKIVPDAFFQDITNNLSKNINKSLSTLQQKSSNVKDLILSSLPVSSVNDGEAFSYDDTIQSIPDEIDLPVAREEAQSKSHSDQFSLIENSEETTLKKKESYEEEKSTRETSSPAADRLSDSNEERKPPDIRSSSSKGDFNLKDNTLVDNIEEEVTNLIVKEKGVDLGSHKNQADDQPKDIVESATEKVHEDLEVLTSEFSNSGCKEILQGANSSDIIIAESTNLLSDTNEKSGITGAAVESEDFQEDVEVQNDQIDDTRNNEYNSSPNTFLQSVGPNQLPSDYSQSISSEPKVENIEVDGSLFKDIESSLSKLSEEKVEFDSKCNLKELKTALESIVQEESSVKKSEVSEKDCAKEELTPQQEKVEVNEASNDGWDDFDFSDEEVENIMTSKTDLKNSAVKETAVSSQKTVDKQICSRDNKTSSTSHTKTESRTASKMEGRSKEGSKKPEEVVQPESTSDDTWDWEDNWDETPEDKQGTASVSSNPKTEKAKDDSSDISKWSGWDTFAQKPQEKQGNWGLGSWGMDVLLNKATAVTQGISNVLEAGLGAPDPETLARMEKLERAKLQEQEVEDPQEYSGETPKKNSLTNVNLFPVSGITSLVAGVTSKIVEHSKIQEIGSKVITGGLDTLETFGKKTMEVLQEGDPGLKNKRALLMGNNKPVLSQVLREAREKADREMKKAEEKELAKKCHFETLFDDFQGMVHLEALEMLSKQCELKLEQIKSGMNSEEQEDLNGILEEVEQLCALDECELDLTASVVDFKTALQMAVEPLKNEISVHKIIEIHENVTRWLETSSETEVSHVIINQKLVSILAELAAATVHQFHKSGELLSVKECRKTVEEVDALSRLTNILCSEINRISEKFISLSRSKGATTGSSDSVNSMSEKATVVMNNSTSYIRQAFDLLIPVLQLGAAV